MLSRAELLWFRNSGWPYSSIGHFSFLFICWFLYVIFSKYAAREIVLSLLIFLFLFKFSLLFIEGPDFVTRCAREPAHKCTKSSSPLQRISNSEVPRNGCGWDGASALLPPFRQDKTVCPSHGQRVSLWPGPDTV